MAGPKLEQNPRPEEALSRVREYFARASPEDVVARAEKLVPPRHPAAEYISQPTDHSEHRAKAPHVLNAPYANEPAVVVLGSLIEKLDAIFHRIQMPRDTAYERAMSLCTAKGFNTTQAIFVLCSTGYGQDAAVLARSLWELLITVLYISQDAQEREERAQEYLRFMVVTRHKSIERARGDAGLEEFLQEADVGPFYESYDRLRSELATEAQARGMDAAEAERDAEQQLQDLRKRQRWTKITMRDMAAAVGRVSEYEHEYRFLSEQVHSDPAGLLARVGAQGNALNVSVGPSPSYVNLVAAMGIQWTVQMMETASHVFGPGFQETIAEVGAALQAQWPKIVGVSAST